MFPELKGNITKFKKFMRKEFGGYMVNRGTEFYAHNEGDAGWFTKQYLEAKKGIGIYAASLK